MAEPGAGRVWRAACPNCGAPVDFQSAAAPMAVCGYCRSTLVRDGETLRRIGQSAELFDDHSPLGLGVRGQFAGESFTLLGRLQYAYLDDSGGRAAEGRWTTWHALFDNGRSATLSEDNGHYVLSWPQAQPDGALPELRGLVPGAQVVVLGRGWALASHVMARVHAMQGEWPCVPQADRPFDIWELRNPQGEVLSIEASTQPPQFDVGRAVRLADLKLSGLPHLDADRPRLKANSCACPSCGASLQPTLDTTQSIVCGSCKAVVDVSKGLGADLAYFKQDNGLEPLIPLGRKGRLALGGATFEWQVVGYQERRSVPASAEEESWFWREYLLYQRSEGFAFLVDAMDGWSLVQPVTGAPRSIGSKVTWLGTDYRKKEDAYAAETTYVLGEFYWPVRKGQKSLNADYVGQGAQANQVLNREMAGKEVTWSAGHTLASDDVVKAFGIDALQRRAFQRDASVASSASRVTVVVLVMFFLVFAILVVATSCDERCGSVRDAYGEYSQEYQQCRASSQSSGGGGYGGSYGGYTSGGSHK